MTGRSEGPQPTLAVVPTPIESIDDLGRLYETEHLAMLRLARLLTGSSMLAEEAVHDAFITVFQRRKTVDQPGAYLKRIVVNNCYSVMRRRSLERKKLEILGNANADRVTIDPDLEETWQALETLKPKQRTALVLRYHEDLALQAVAEMMGERLGTVKSLIHRALKQLRNELAGESSREPETDLREKVQSAARIRPGDGPKKAAQHVRNNDE